MKSLRKFASLLLFICFAVSAYAQSVSKTVVITKTKMDANGNQVTETITKTGEAALNFNLDDYLESTKDEFKRNHKNVWKFIVSKKYPTE